MSDTTQVVQNDYTTWRALLAGEKPPLVNDEPATGYYRVRSGDRSTWIPIAYWYTSGGTLCCAIGIMDADKKIARLDDTSAREKWSFACKHPITHEVYKLVTEGGKWPDENEAVAGHNKSPVADDLAAINDRIDDLGREAEKLILAGAAKNAANADQASDLANTFGELEKKADRLREEEKAPHLEQGRAVDGKWRTVINRASDLKSRLKRYVVTPFLTKQEEERQKIQAAAVAKGVAPDAVPEVRTTAGSSKRSTGLRTVKSAEITDYDALLAHLKNHPDVKAAVERIANASAKAGVDLPGMKIVSSKVAA